MLNVLRHPMKPAPLRPWNLVGAALLVVLMVLLPPRAIAAWSVVWTERAEPEWPAPRRLLPVISLEQRDSVANCGLTAAAMLIGAYHYPTDPVGQARLRDDIGQWSWARFPMRAWHLPEDRQWAG